MHVEDGRCPCRTRAAAPVPPPLVLPGYEEQSIRSFGVGRSSNGRRVNRSQLVNPDDFSALTALSPVREVDEGSRSSTPC
jgi:hypothetical protein